MGVQPRAGAVVRILRLVLGGIVGAAVLSLGPGAAWAAPPGNNGTVEVDGAPFDDDAANEPHVDCVFQIDFYGYDQGDLQATYTLTIHPPSGQAAVLATGSLSIGEDAAGGGTDLDGSATIDLSGALAGFEPHPNQGFHVFLTIEAEGSIGADVKHKVFWVTCEGYPPTSAAAPALRLAARSTSPVGPAWPTVGQLLALAAGVLAARGAVHRALRLRRPR